MSVDKLRGSYHVNRVSPNEIGLLMSAQSYRPAVTQAINKIKEGKWRTLQSLISNVISPGPHPKYGGDYPCLKTKNVQDLIANTTPADWADVSSINDLAKVQVCKGDLLINLTGAGSIGRVSVYYGDDLPITNQHIAKMSPNSLIDEGYLVAYLRSSYAERALEQGVAGSTGQINMVNEHVRSTPVRICHSSAQKYIGDKVRQAECLRTWGKDIRKTLESLEKEIPIKPYPKTDKKYSISGVFELTENRLDAEFYEDRHIDLYRQFTSEFRSLGDITHGFKYGSSVKADYVEKDIGIAFIRGNAINANEVSYQDIVYLDPSLEDDLKSNFLNIGDVMITRSGTVGAVCDVYEGFDRYAYGSFIINCKPKPDVIDSKYLSWYLNGWVGQQQFRRWENGAVQLNINTEELAAIEVWIAPVEFQQKIAEQIKLLRIVNRLSQHLVTSAKLLVEELIEDNISEAELVAAQQALEAGDDSLDRVLLERVTADGIDGDGAPLFDDIDQLYELLEQAAQAEESMPEA